MRSEDHVDTDQHDADDDGDDAAEEPEVGSVRAVTLLLEGVVATAGQASEEAGQSAVAVLRFAHRVCHRAEQVAGDVVDSLPGQSVSLDDGCDADEDQGYCCDYTCEHFELLWSYSVWNCSIISYHKYSIFAITLYQLKKVYNRVMQIDQRLNDIDDCLYRVAVRVLIVENDKVLLVKEKSDDWWALPGGGVDHGDSIEATLLREVEEELGVPANAIKSDFNIIHNNIGNVVNGVPRMNLFFTATVPSEMLAKTDHVAEWQWFNREEFIAASLHSSYDKTKLADIIFSKS